MKIIKNTAAFFLAFLLLVGCNNDTVVDDNKPATQNDISEIHQNGEDAFNESDLVGKSLTQPLNTLDELESSDVILKDDNNPYDNDFSISFWQYYLFEMYRGSSLYEFSTRLEYESSGIKGEWPLMSFQLSYPQIEEQSQFAERFNDYYANKLQEQQELENHYIDTVITTNTVHGVGYKQYACYAYVWGNSFTSIIDETISINRTVSNPICENFDLSLGKRLTLEDIFVVDYNEYSLRITQSLKTPSTDYEPFLYPWYSNGTESIPMPTVENFMVTPSGLAFVYSMGEIADNASRAVVLYVEYSDVLDILCMDFRLANNL